METEHTSPEDKAVVKFDPNLIPDEIPILPLDNQVAFPKLNMSLAVPVAASSLIETAMKGNKLIGVLGHKRQVDDDPLPGEIYKIGTIVRILYVTRAPDNTVLMVAHGLKRFRIDEWIPGKDFLSAKIKLTPEILEADIETEALHRNLRDLTKEIFSLTFGGPDESIERLAQINDPLHLAYIAAANSEIGFEARQAVLEENSLKAKLRNLITMLSREKEILSLGEKIKSEVHDKMSKSQREYYLRQKLKAIKKELGETDDTKSEPDNYQQRIAESDMSDEARKEACGSWTAWKRCHLSRQNMAW